MKSALENLGKWQNYVHYFLLAGGLVLFLHFLGIHYFHESVWNFLKLVIAIFIIDTIVHFIFYIAPRPIQWRD